MRRWTEADDAYLAANWATEEMWRMKNHLDRSRDSIQYRAKVLGLQRRNPASVKRGEIVSEYTFRPGYEPWNMERGAGILAELKEHKERTVLQLCIAMRISSSMMWKALANLRARGLIYVARWEPVPSAPGNIRAIYRPGRGEDAPRPNREQRIELNAPDPFEIQPVPQPLLGLWGLVWPTTPAEPATHGREA